MKTETLKGEIKTVFGRELTEALKYEGDVELLETKQEVMDSKEGFPSEEEIVSFRNTQRRNNKRQALMAEKIEEAAKAWQGEAKDNPFVKPTLESSADLRYKAIYDALIADKKTPAEAERIAKMALGLN